MSTDLSSQVSGIKDDYKYGFRDSDANYSFKARKGLDRQVVEQISDMKGEPDWMRKLRLQAHDVFWSKPTPQWGGDLGSLNFDDIHYYMKAADRQGKTWDDVPAEIKNTFDKLGIPEAERKFLAGVGAQYESEVVYHSLREDLQKKGVIFVDTDTALREHPDLVRQYYATVIPIHDNKFAALNSAVLRSTMSRVARRPCIRPRVCTPPSSRSSSRRAAGAATPRSRTGRATSTTS
jgi:Fe-S cluster assembly protein SufB